MGLKYYFAPGASSLAGLVALEAAHATYEPHRLVLALSRSRSCVAASTMSASWPGPMS